MPILAWACVCVCRVIEVRACARVCVVCVHVSGVCE